MMRRTKRTSRRQKTGVIIDVHTHIFNCRFLPIDGILKNWFRRAGIPDEIAEAVASIVNASTDDCSSRPLGKLQRQLDARITEVEDEDALIEILWQQTPPEAFAALPVLRAWTRLAAKGKPRELAKAKFFALFHEAARGRPVELFETASGFLKWLVLMTRCEARIFRMLRRAYPTASLFVHHMMDMDNYYPGSSHYPFVTDQLPRIRDLVAASGSHLLAFVAFDPRREEWKEILNVALDAGCVGVKFYPPNGYKPSEDPDPVVRDRIEKFFACCVQRDVPVFTHCTPHGFEAYKCSGRLSDPVNWRPVLRANRSLRLCFAHAGGGAFWFGHSEAEGYVYGERVVELCRTHPNVYCEVGYLDEILTPNGPKRFRAILETLLATPGNEGLADRIMYGTDWHMIFRLRDHRHYLAAFEQAFDSPILRRIRNRFFRENAIRYLKLSPSAIARPRRFYKSKP
jgi:predicted TIM-barrel fold metal-dependent hydrolase